MLPNDWSLPLPKFNTEHAFLRKFGIPPDFGANITTKPMIITAVKTTLIFAAKTFIFLNYPKTFIAGLILGVMCDEACYAAIERLKAVWDHQGLVNKTLMCIGSFYGLSALIFAVALLTGAHLGAKLYQELPSN